MTNRRNEMKKTNIGAFWIVMLSLSVSTRILGVNVSTNEIPDYNKPEDKNVCEECDSCSEQTKPDNHCISFTQGFGRTPWIAGAPKGALRVYRYDPSYPVIGSKMLCYDHPAERKIIYRSDTNNEITVQSPTGKIITYKNGMPYLRSSGMNLQCRIGQDGLAVEMLEDRTQVVYGPDNAVLKLITPRGVEILPSDLGITLIKDLDGIRQAWSRTDGLMDVTVPPSGGKLVSWYPPSAVSASTNETGLYTFSGLPAKTFTFQGTSYNGRRIVTPRTLPNGTTAYEISYETLYGLTLEERRGTEFSFSYEWRYDWTSRDWTFTRGAGDDLVTDRLIRFETPGTSTVTRVRYNASEKYSSRERNVYLNDLNGFTLIKSSFVDDSGKETVTSGADSIKYGENAGRLSSRSNAYGGSTAMNYDSYGRLTNETETVSGSISQITTRTYKAPGQYGFVDRRPTRTVVTQDGVAVSDTSYGYSYMAESITRTDPKTGTALTTVNYLYSPISANPLERGRVKLTVNPDWSVTYHTYAEGENGAWTNTVTQGYWYRDPNIQYVRPPDPETLFNEVPGKSTRTVITHDFRGDVVRTDSYVHTGSVFTLAGSETHTYNIMHKRLGSMRHDGTSDMSNWICTGPVWQRNADGTSVTNTFDTAKRIKTSTRYTPFGNITTTYSYDADNRVIAQSVATNGIATGLASSAVYDTQGRVILSTDTQGRTNRTSYSLDSRTVTQTDPAGAIVIESYGTDGSLLSRTGTVMRAEYYTQGVDAASGTRWEKTTYGSPAGADYTRSHYNALGQLVLQERPGFGSSTLKTVYAYNTKGQLESESRVVQGGTGTYDLPVTTYAYNQLGDRVATTQTAANVSRIQSSDGVFTFENGIVQQTSVSIQSCSDATILPMTNSTITRLYPLTNGVLSVLAESRNRDVRGNETVQTVTQNPATYIRMATVSNATSVLPAISISLAGLTLSQTDQHGCATIYGYDALMRQISAETRSGQNNERLTGAYTHYNDIGQVDCTEDAIGSRTVYGYEPGTGRRIYTTQVGKPTDPVLTTYTAYDSANRTIATWGATYPVAYEYDTAERMTAMYTYRGADSINSYADIAALKPQMDRTQWFYDQATGLLTNKLYADGKGPSYSYTALGQLSTRKWARHSSSGQQLLTSYKYENFGSLTNTAYSDGTPSVSFTVDAMGRPKVAQTILPLTGEIISCTTNIYTGIDLVAEIQNGVRIDRQVDAFGRPKELAIGQDYSVEYGFDEYGRFGSVTSMVNGSVDNWQYNYLPGSHLIAGITQPTYSIRKTYEPHRDLITSVSNTFGTATISTFVYENDGLGRRTAGTDTTPSLTVNNAFGYNLRSEVTSATMANGDSSYDYDPIGNRVFSSLNAATNTYTANSLNQYSSLQPKDLQPINLSYDLDGNMLTNGVWSYIWDAENRLTSVYSNNTLLVSNTFDHQSRRIAKTTAEGTRTFIWDGWNLISETLLTSNFSLPTFYTWGLDLSGTLQGAGGVGGLLAVHTSPLHLGEGQGEGRTVFPFYDANGNVTEYIDASGAIRAHYTFDAFGNTISQSGDLAATFSHRFSTKYFDAETGLMMYQLRAYSPEEGKWLSRDPIGIIGGLNITGFLQNDPNDQVDIFGLACADQCGPDVTTAVQNTLQNVENRFNDWAAIPGKQRSACEALYDGGLADGAWDIKELAAAGKSEGCGSLMGTGKCKATVAYKGKCYHAGAVNYVLFGKMNALCRNIFRGSPYKAFGNYPVTWSYHDMMLAIAFQKYFHYGLWAHDVEKGFGYAAGQAFDMGVFGFANEQPLYHSGFQFGLKMNKLTLKLFNPIFSIGEALVDSTGYAGYPTEKCDTSCSKPVESSAFTASWKNEKIEPK